MLLEIKTQFIRSLSICVIKSNLFPLKLPFVPQVLAVNNIGKGPSGVKKFTLRKGSFVKTYQVNIYSCPTLFTTVFAYAKRELRIEGRFEAILPSLLHSVRCKQKAVDRWLADLHVTPLSL